MSRFQERLADYKNAVERLDEALKEPESDYHTYMMKKLLEIFMKK